MNIYKMGYSEEKVDPRNGITYVRNGDYWIPKLTVAPWEVGPSLGRWGMMRMNFLKEHRKAEYTERVLHENLYTHCREVEKLAESRMEIMMEQFPKAAGVTEELKHRDPMKWVGLMNNCKAQAEEIIKRELIYE